MRKITIPVSALVALSAIQVAQAATISVDFGKAPADGNATIQSGNVVLDGFTFVGNNNKVTLTKSGFYTGGSSNNAARHIYFTPSKNGTLIITGIASADNNNERYILVATAPVSDANASTVVNKVAISSKSKTSKLTVSGLVAGTTYYICLAGNGTIKTISYEEASPSKDVNLQVKKDATSAKTEITLNKGTYAISANGGDYKSLEVKEGDAVMSDNNAVVVTKNGTKLTVTLTLAAKADADKNFSINCAISDGSLSEVKSVYTQKIAVMINKANVYTNDTRLQGCAQRASSLMATANGMGLAQYDEYVTTGKIASLEADIAQLSGDIDNAKAAYDGYVYAQTKYGNKYENGAWVLDETNKTSLLAKKKELDDAYKSAQANVKEEAALAELKAAYDNAVASLTDYKNNIDTEYKDGKQTDLDAYKALIDKKASDVLGSLDGAKNGIVNGDGNAISYANVNTFVNDAKAKYDTEANKLYNLLANNADEKDGDIYRDMYVESLGKLNEYLRVINDVKAANQAEYEAGKCTKETQAEFEAKLKIVETIDTVYTYYETKATTLRANYKAACSNINSALTGYLKEQIKDVIGKKNDKDYARKEISEFYAANITEIENDIKAIQGKVDDANKAHTIGDGTDVKYYAAYATDTAAVLNKIDELSPKVVKSVREFDGWESSKTVVADLQADFDLYKNGKNDIIGVKNTVSKDKVYNQSVKFAAEYERTIQERINALKDAANASFKADGTGTAEVFYQGINDNQEKDGKVTLYGKTEIAANITGYKEDAAAALAKYEKVVAALASYDVALNGKKAVGEEGKDGYVPAVVGLKEVATNLDVTIDGTFEGQTYGEYIAAVEKKIGATEGLKKQLDDAVAKNDTAHVKAMAALATFDDLVSEIQKYQTAYADNDKAWNKEQLSHAKKSMLAEATRRVGVIDTKSVVVNEVYKDTEYNTVVDEKATSASTTSYEKTTYGKWIDDQKVKENDKEVTKPGLNSLLKQCNDAVAAINTKISNADKSSDDAAAIAILSEVVEDLKQVEGQYNALRDQATKSKMAYTAEKVARKTLLEAVKGKGGINEELAKVTFEKNGVNMFAEESAKQSTAITKLTDDIAAKFEAETVVANKEALTKAKDAIVTAVANLNGLVAKESANKKADDAYAKADKDANITKAVADAKAAIAKAVADKKAVQDSDAYKYFMETVLAGYETDYTKLGTARTTANGAVIKALDKDGKTVLAGALDQAKYTDPAKNMTAVGNGLAEQLATLKSNIVGVADLLIACEADYKEQSDKAGDLDKLRAEVFATITSAETSSYHEQALAELLAIDGEIAAYKDAKNDAYKKGANTTDKTKLTAQATAVETKLNTLKNGWNDEYDKAVAKDNEARKVAFDDAYTALTTTYAKDVEIIARLSKLSYADDFGDDLKEVVGPAGIYSYADKIRDLKKKTEEAYTATAAPNLFDGGEKFKAEAETMKAEIDTITTKYTKLVNEAAEVKYNAEAAAVVRKLNNAKKEVRLRLGFAFATNDFLATAFDDVQTIIDEAKGYAEAKDDKGNFVHADFAEYLDKTIIPKFASVDDLIDEDKTKAAVKSYNDRLAAYRTLANSEAALIAGYNGEDGTLGAFSEEYKTFVETSIDKAEALWANIEDDKKYTSFTEVATGETMSVRTALSRFGTPAVHSGYNKDDKEQPKEWAEKHTAKYWTAYDVDQKYHANDNSYAAMQTKVSDVQAELDKAEAFVASLIVRNNSNLADRFDIAQGLINDLTAEAEGYHNEGHADTHLETFKNKCDAQIETIKLIVEGKTGDAALLTENTAVEVQIGFLQHDYNQAAAANIDNADFVSQTYKDAIAGYSKKNDRILKDFTEGKVDDKGAPVYVDNKPVYASAEETRQAFIALETEVGQMKAELTALYNAAATAAAQKTVQQEIDKLTATYDAFVAQLDECHAPVKEEYQPQVDAFKAEIDALQAVLDAEVANNTILLYQDEDVTTAQNIAETVAQLSADIADMEKPYDVNDVRYLELLGQLNALQESLDNVYEVAKGYDHQQTGNYNADIDGDGEVEEYSSYAEFRYAMYTYRIAKDKEWLEEENSKYNLKVNSEPTLYTISGIQDDINNVEKQCAYYNARTSIRIILTDLGTALSNIDNLGYTATDKSELASIHTALETNTGYLSVYNRDAQRGYVEKDIEGNKIVVDGEEVAGKSVVYMEEYPAIMDKVAEISKQVTALVKDTEDRSWIKGDVDHNGRITVADYDAVRQMVLEIVEYSETDAKFYAADVNEDGFVNIGDVTQIGSKIMEDKDFVKKSAVRATRAAGTAGVADNGSLSMMAEGSGMEQTIRLAVDTRKAYVGGQFDIALPAGVRLMSVASSSHDALMNMVDGNARVLVSNIENTEIAAGQTFVELNVEVSSDYNGEDIEVVNAQFATNDGTVYRLAKASLPTPTGLTSLTTTEKVASKVYSAGGMLMNKIKKGLNIIVNSDGTTKKVVK